MAAWKCDMDWLIMEYNVSARQRKPEEDLPINLLAMEFGI